MFHIGGVASPDFIDSNNNMYIQYVDQCQDRISLTKHVMDYLKNSVPDLPKYVIHNKRINPSANTIDVCAKNWIDCNLQSDPLK